MRDRFPVGAGGNYQPNATYDNAGKTGVNEVTLNLNQIPSHSHTTYLYSKSNPGDKDQSARGSSGDSQKAHQSTYAGGDMPHENRPPFYGIYFIKKVSNNCPD
jgi:microcystin-dependent protein